MTAVAKICGIDSRAAMDAALEGGAAFVGLVFYPPSPRAVTPRQAAAIVPDEPSLARTVGLFVDPSNEALDAATAAVTLDLVQLHGNEPPARAADLRARFGLPIIKAIKIKTADDVAQAERYVDVVDWLLFDAKPPEDLKTALPGGNALSFDWSLLAGRQWPVPWILSGGLDADNVAEAIRLTGAPAVDVSSGVERERGKKDPERIRVFLNAVRAAART